MPSFACNRSHPSESALRDLYLQSSSPKPNAPVPLQASGSPQKYQSSWVHSYFLYKERWPGHQWAMAPFYFSKGTLSPLYLSQLNPLTPECPIFWVLDLYLNQAFWLSYWVQHFNCLLPKYLMSSLLMTFVWAPRGHLRLYKHQAGINDASSFTAWKENI